MDHDTHDLVSEILQQMAMEKRKSIDRIMHLLLIDQNRNVNRRFWEILDSKFPTHSFNYVGCCPHCGSLELVTDHEISIHHN